MRLRLGSTWQLSTPRRSSPTRKSPQRARNWQENLIFNRSDAALPDFIAYFDSVVTSEDDQSAKADPFEGLSKQREAVPEGPAPAQSWY
jgi:hypothetical protein